MTDNQSPIDVALDVLVYAPLGLAATVGEELPKLAAKGRARVQVARMVGQFALAQGRKEVGRRFGAGEPPKPVATTTAPQGPRPTPSADGAAATGVTADGGAATTGVTADRGAATESATSAVGAAPSPLAGSGGAAPGASGPDGAHPAGRSPSVPRAASPAPSPAPSAAPSTPSADPSRPGGSSRPDRARRRTSSRPAGRPGGGAAGGTGAASPAAETASPSPEHLAIPGYDSLSASQVVQRLAGLSAEELEAVKAYEAGTRGRRTILARVGQLQGS